MVRKGWKQVTLGDIALFQGGSQPPLSVFSSQKKAGYIRLVQIRDYKTDKYATYIPEKLAKRFCKQDDIMIGRYGPPIFQILRGIEGAYNVALIKALPQGVDKEFLYHTLKREDLFQYIDLLSRRTSGQTGVDLTNLKAFELSIPVLTDEQAAIAKALSDVDSLTSSLQKLIEKKKAIKQGAMQELLTGKKRLPEFSGEWNQFRLGEMTEIYSGGTPSTTISEYWGGSIPWMSSGELNNKKIYDVEGRITQKGMQNSSAHLIPKYCVLIGLAGQGKTRGTAAYNYISLCTNQSIAAIYPNDKKFDSRFLYYIIDSMYESLRELSSGDGGRGGLTKGLISNLEIYMPEVPEQQAVAQVLSDMDSEIEQLEKKLAKYQQIKQGMMQELLTGRIRLVDADVKKSPEAHMVREKQHQPTHNQHFDDAVMIAGIVNAFYSEKYPLGRKKVQKLLYLVRRKEQADISAFHKKAAGPYADEIRYKGGEPIAQKNKYIQVKRSEKGSRFEKGVQMQQALTYLQDWGKQGDVDWLVSQFQYTSVNELELLATVDMAICDLRREGKETSVASIKDLIRSNKEWRDKLKKTYFRDSDIQRAIIKCQDLFES